MPFHEIISFVWLLVSVAVQLAVMYVCFPLGRKQRLRFALLFAWAALVGLFQLVLEQVPQCYPVSDETLGLLWNAVHVSATISMSLYATAVVLLVRHFNASPVTPSRSGQTENAPLA